MTTVLAYLDPGSGSMILQIIAGGVAAVAVTAKLYWNRILGSSASARTSPRPAKAEPPQRQRQPPRPARAARLRAPPFALPSSAHAP